MEKEQGRRRFISFFCFSGRRRSFLGQAIALYRRRFFFPVRFLLLHNLFHLLPTFEPQQPPFLLSRAAASLLSAAVIATTAAPAFAPPPFLPQAQAMLTAGDPVKNARALLRNALPIDNKPMRTIQSSLEGVSEQLRVPGSKALGGISRAVKKASGTLAGKKGEISAAFAPSKKAAGDAALEGLDKALKSFEAVLETGDKQQIPAAQQAALAYVSQAEEALVKGFPFDVPSKYASLPQLKGRATLEMKLTLKEARQDGVKGGLLTIVADGYNAPVTVRGEKERERGGGKREAEERRRKKNRRKKKSSLSQQQQKNPEILSSLSLFQAGNFVDLASKKFYDGMEIQRADGFVVQTVRAIFVCLSERERER